MMRELGDNEMHSTHGAGSIECGTAFDLTGFGVAAGVGIAAVAIAAPVLGIPTALILAVAAGSSVGIGVKAVGRSLVCPADSSRSPSLTA
jgi:hypothetical protein